MNNISIVKKIGFGQKLKKDLVDFFPLNESSGNRRGVFRDLILTDNNTVTGVSGICGSSGSQFVKANSEYLSSISNNNFQIGSSNKTFVLWLKLDSKADYYLALRKWGSSSADQSFQLYYDQPSDKFAWQLRRADITSTVTVTETSFTPVIGTWFMLTVWHDANNDQIGIASNNNNPFLSSFSFDVFESSSEFGVGGSSTAAPDYWNGGIQKVGIWNRVLSQEERIYLYNNGCGRNWPFNSNN